MTCSLLLLIFTVSVVKSEPGLQKTNENQSFPAPLLMAESFLSSSVDVKMESN